MKLEVQFLQTERLDIYCVFLIILLRFCVTFAQQCDVTAVSGDAAIVPLGYSEFTPDNDLVWRRNGVTMFDRYRGTVLLGKEGDVTSNGSLVLLNVKKYQEGEYSGEIRDGSRPIYTTAKFLCVTAELLYGLIAEEILLDPKVDETIGRITWEKEKEIIEEWVTGRALGYYPRCRSAEQCVLDLTTGALVLKGLKPEDEGKYTVTVNNKGRAREFTLTVLTPVSKPTVTASCNETRCTLTCVGLETKSATYSWKENSDTVKDVEGNTLMVEKSGDLHKRYSCVFSNPKSGKESDPLTEMDLFLEAVSKPHVSKSCGESRCTLTCVGKETEYAEYSWKKNRETLKEGNTLTVGRTGFLSQSYTCVFRNPKSEAKSDPVYEMDLFACASHDSTVAIVLSVFVTVAVAGAVVGTYLKRNPCRRMNCLRKSRVDPCNQVSTTEQVSSVTHRHPRPGDRTWVDPTPTCVQVVLLCTQGSSLLIYSHLDSPSAASVTASKVFVL
ncbi:uncharacterized protein LOC108926891 isoform X1 [Scleropages formosus]|uniref:uncharacterized protein LOC108926891 isoform X1 n=1 Tax=Scleropages formosus TaxID=113540 RepID=UPI0010FA760D|nr:uncharacterized protein LOC108926891 isoform X1 [Scleropages formosus]